MPSDIAARLAQLEAAEAICTDVALLESMRLEVERIIETLTEEKHDARIESQTR